MPNYNKIFTTGNVYIVSGRKARYWGTDGNSNQRRILVFFDVRTDECIEVPTNELDKIQEYEI